MAFVYGEKLIEYAIRVGIDDIQEDPTLIDLMFFTDKKLKQGNDLGEVNGQRVTEPLPFDYFQKRLSEIPKTRGETGKIDIFKNAIPNIPDIKQYLIEANIKIIHGFPREAEDLPCISITLGNENEKQYLGGIKGRVVRESDGKGYDLIGSDWLSQYNINIMTPNYDETVIWGYLIKFALTRYRGVLEGYGIRGMSISIMDVEPAPEYMQAGLFIYQRAIMINCEKDEDIPILGQEAFTELAFQVNGSEIPPTNGQIIPEPEA